MKRKALFLVMIVLLIGTALLGCNSGGDVEYTILTKPFCISPGGEGGGCYELPRGSTVYHLSNGTTRVHGPENDLILKVWDAQASRLASPGGGGRAPYQLQTPSGSHIRSESDYITKVYSESGELLLTIITTYEREHCLTPPAPVRLKTYFPKNIEIENGKMGFIDVTVINGYKAGEEEPYDLRNVNYQMFIVSEVGNENELPIPEGLSISIDRVSYGGRPGIKTHVSTITIQTTAKLALGKYFLFIEQDIENIYQGKGWIRVNIVE